MWSTAFWAEVLERAIKTFAQVSAALLAGNQLGILAVNFADVASVAALASLVSVLTSIGSAPFGTAGSASLVTPPGLDRLAAATRGLVAAVDRVPANVVVKERAETAGEVLEDLSLRKP